MAKIPETILVPLDVARRKRLREAAKKLKMQERLLAQRYLVAGIEAQGGGGPVEPPPVDPPPVEPPPPDSDPDGWVGGPVGRGGKSRVVRGERITKTLPSDLANVDFVDCSAKGIFLFPGKLGPNVRWLGGTIDDMGTDPAYHHHGIYINVGLRPFPLNFVLQRAKCRGWKGGIKNKIEMKASFYAIVGNNWEDSTGTGIRLRHGEQNIVSGNSRLGSVSLRDNLNLIAGNTGGHVTAWAGRLMGGFDNWKDDRTPNSGNNYYSAVENFIAVGEGNQDIFVGAPSGASKQFKDKKAVRNCIEPGSRPRAKLLNEEGTYPGTRQEWERSRRQRFLELAVRETTLEELLRLPARGLEDDDPDELDEELGLIEEMIAHADEARSLA